MEARVPIFSDGYSSMIMKGSGQKVLRLGCNPAGCNCGGMYAQYGPSCSSGKYYMQKPNFFYAENCSKK
jgi:hypothetical protein